MEKVPIKAVLFDLDGVITDTARYHYLAWKRLADEHGLEFDEEVNYQLRGVPRMESLEAILRHNQQDFPSAQKESMCKVKNDYYLEFVEKITPADLEPNSAEILRALREKGVKNVLCSSSKNAPGVVSGLGVTDLFDEMVDAALIENGKPAPDIFLQGARQAGVSPDHCLVVEDAESGVAAGKAAGMRVLGIGDPMRLTEADRVVSGLVAITVSAMLDI